MKLYKITQTGIMVDIAGTQADAKTQRKALEDATGFKMEWSEEEVPVDKAGLMSWIKTNACKTPGE